MAKSAALKIPASDEAWDSRQLGADPEYLRVAKGVDEQKLNKSLGLVPVSIRLQQSLIDDFKLIAALNGLGYQSLMRQVLTRFAVCEMKAITREVLSDQARHREDEVTDESGNEIQRKRA